MQTILKRHGIATRALSVAVIVASLGSARVLAAYPEIHVSWATGTPVEGYDYDVETTGEGSPDFPNVKLYTGNLTWKVWSTDTDNPDDIGDIGVISCPAAANFGVKIENGDNDGPGAREVKAINLEPTNVANYSTLTGGEMTGDLTGNLTVVQDGSSNGGEVNLTIGGDVGAGVL